jgi:hypothetical protein
LIRSYIFGLSLAALVATVACSSSSPNPSGGGGSAGSGGGGGGSGFSCYDLVKEDGGVAGCGMLTYSAGVVSGGCGGATPNSGSCPSANLAGCCVTAPQTVGGTSDTVQDITCYYGGASIAAMGKMLCAATWQTSVP